MARPRSERVDLVSRTAPYPREQHAAHLLVAALERHQAHPDYPAALLDVDADPASDGSQQLAAAISAARQRVALGPAGLVQPSGGGEDLPALVDLTVRMLADSITLQTRESYHRRWVDFAAWCDRNDLRALPALPETVMAFLAELVAGPRHLTASTLYTFLAAINRVHLECGHPRPGDDPGMRLLMRGAKRYAALRPPKRKTALRIEELRRVCRSIGDRDLAQCRDKAMLALNYAGIPPGALGLLRWSDVTIDGEQATLGLRRTKRTRLCEERVLLRSADRAICPVAALEDWAELCGQDSEAVFNLVDSDGRCQLDSLCNGEPRRLLWARERSLGFGTGTRERRPLSDDEQQSLLRALSAPTSAALRDLALILLGFTVALRTGELARARFCDVRTVEQGLILHLPRSKTDIAGVGHDLAIPFGRNELTCPVRAFQAWQTRAQDRLGEAWDPTLPIALLVRWDRVRPHGIGRQMLAIIVRRRAQDAGLPGHWAGVSLRAGFCTTAAEAGLGLDEIAEVSRHRQLDTLRIYIRRQASFSSSAAGRVGL